MARKNRFGHWGTNPGHALIVGHLLESSDEALSFVFGTGHATSFHFAQACLSERIPFSDINDEIAKYCVEPGYSSELLQVQGNPPLFFGELGGAISVAQGFSTTRPNPTVCVVGDGELETPKALAALAHGRKLCTAKTRPPLIAVNHNGYRMGGASEFTPEDIASIFSPLGYQIVESRGSFDEAREAASFAVAQQNRGRQTIWISVSEKGWPAPPVFLGQPFEL